MKPYPWIKLYKWHLQENNSTPSSGPNVKCQHSRKREKTVICQSVYEKERAVSRHPFFIYSRSSTSRRPLWLKEKIQNTRKSSNIHLPWRLTAEIHLLPKSVRHATNTSELIILYSTITALLHIQIMILVFLMWGCGQYFRRFGGFCCIHIQGSWIFVYIGLQLSAQ
jgi:hypothetical protein